MWCVATGCSSNELEWRIREIQSGGPAAEQGRAGAERTNQRGWGRVQPLTMPSHMTSMLIEESM